MKIKCNKCGKQYDIPKEKIPSNKKYITAKCVVCKNLIKIKNNERKSNYNEKVLKLNQVECYNKIESTKTNQNKKQTILHKRTIDGQQKKETQLNKKTQNKNQKSIKWYHITDIKDGFKKIASFIIIIILIKMCIFFLRDDEKIKNAAINKATGISTKREVGNVINILPLSDNDFVSEYNKLKGNKLQNYLNFVNNSYKSIIPKKINSQVTCVGIKQSYRTIYYDFTIDINQ